MELSTMSRMTADLVEVNLQSDWQPVSRIQAKMFELHQLRPQADILSRAALVKGDLDLEQLGLAFDWIYGRHPILSSVFSRQQGGQIMRRSLINAVPLVIRNCTQLTVEEQEAMIREDSTRPFDIGQDPLLRTLVYQLAPKEYLMVLQCHHLVADGGTLVLWVGWLLQSYTSLQTTGKLPEFSVEDRYAQYTDFEQKYLQSTKGIKASKYWQEHLHQAALQTIPQDDLSRSLHCGIENAILVDERYQQCKASCQQEHVSLVARCAAAYQQAMLELCPVQPYLSATLSLRLAKKYRTVVGPLFMQALLQSGSPDESLAARSKRLGHEILGGQLRVYGGDTIGPHGSLGKTLPLEYTALFGFFSSSSAADSFAFGDSGGRVEIGPELSLESYELPWRLTPYGLFLSVADYTSELRLKLIHNFSAYPQDMAEKILQRITSLLAG
ncbi:MAG: hypothetical protein D3903_07850 [Candidatus Electrothrix sp. GM3_4]|nr:hypothetical protein [Candidatus Electrothrix sp. GM3_4]